MNICMMGGEMTIPPLFRCPISLDLLKDPVTLCTGQTYERSCIQKWLAAGNLTCPVTMQKLDNLSVVPNHTLRHFIHRWLRSEHPTGEENRGSIARMVEELDGSTLDDKLRLLDTIRSLARELPLKNSHLIELDFFGLVLQMLFRNIHSLVLVEEALSCVVELMPFSELGSLCTLLKHDSKYAAFLLLFEQGNTPIRRSLFLIVEAIASSGPPHLRGKLGQSGRLVRIIVDVLSSQHKSEGGVEAGIRALWALSSMESNRKKMVSNGAVEGLIACLSNADARRRSSAAMAMSVIENLLSTDAAKEAVLKHDSGVEAIVKMVFRVSEHGGSESAVNSLLIVCLDSESAREEAIGGGVLTQLLLLLQSQCSGSTKTKARMLLKLLRS